VRPGDERGTVNIRTGTLAAALVVLLLAAAAVASGCGSTSADDGVAALDDAAATTSEGDESTASNGDDEDDPQEVALAWAKCMREHGVDVPDPEVDENGRVRVMIQGRRAAEGVRDDTFAKARDECGTPFGDAGPPPLSEEERAKMQETMLEFAACMREHGVDMPDPDFSDGGGRFGFGGTNVDPQSSTFQKAQEACQDIIEDAFGSRGPGLRVGGGAGGDDGPSTNRDEDAS
jgi:hypothetical protein